MSRFARSHLPGSAVLSSLKTNDATNRRSLADLLADLGEVDERQLYREAAYSSLHDYCIDELNWTEDCTYKRIRVARTAREFPAIFHAIADGRLNLSGVLLLKPQLSHDNVDELMVAAARKTRRQIEQMLADRTPMPDLATRLAPVEVTAAAGASDAFELAPGPISSDRAKLEPLGTRRFGLQVTIDQETTDLLQRAQQLLSHRQCSKDVAKILHRALEVLVTMLEKRKFATTDRPRRVMRGSENPRYVPAAVKRAVRERDGDRCTYVCPETGRRCTARERLEYDHVVPVARGGRPTLDNLRQRCRAHNQLEAERVFGRDFMERRRAEASDPDRRDLIFGLRNLGYRAAEARAATDLAMRNSAASLEERMRAALAWLRPMSASGTRTAVV